MVYRPILALSSTTLAVVFALSGCSSGGSGGGGTGSTGSTGGTGGDVSAPDASSADAAVASDAMSTDAAGAAGGPVSGAVNPRCTGVPAHPVDPAVCQAQRPAGTDPGEDEDYGDTLYNSEGDGDDCKYHFQWTATPIAQGSAVTFTLTATYLTDGTPATGAADSTSAEVYLDDKHPAPPTDQKTTETAPGVYTIGPVTFDAAGQWTVRFHIFETCTDVDEKSPHGHAAFYVNVP